MSAKGFIILFISVSSTVGSGHAQMLLGLKQGVNISSIKYDQRFDQFYQKIQNINGYAGGIIFQYFSEKHFGLQAELQYSQKGFKTQYDSAEQTQYERRINYLTLPLLTHFYFSKKKTTPYLIAGFFGSLALNSKEIFYDQGSASDADYHYDPERDNRSEYGLIGGAGFKADFSFGTFQVEGTYAYTLNSLYKWGYVSTDPDFDRYFIIPEQALNKCLQVSLAYMIPVKKKTF